jgi:energy-coupling factor transporter ATP-binding protein EcfA2
MSETEEAPVAEVVVAVPAIPPIGVVVPVMPTLPKIILPRVPVLSVTVWPKNIIIFSKPKTGKTTLLSQLPNCLTIDLEDGSDFVDGLKIKANSIPQLRDIGNEIVAQGRPYSFIALDTITKLEEMCIPMAEQLYSKTSMGKAWFTEGKAKYGSILNMPNGAGYPYLREAFMKVIAYVKTLAPNIILSGHIKDTLLEKAGVEFTSSELDLTGKIKRQICSESDAIGYLFRKGKETILSFKTSDEIACGARPVHLRGKEIVIADEDDQGTFHTYWDRVYPVAA